jgi:hypothetical protein
VQNTMARLATQEPAASTSPAHTATNLFDISPTERSAIKQEGKRLVRAAQQHCFLLMSTSALIRDPAKVPLSPQRSLATPQIRTGDSTPTDCSVPFSFHAAGINNWRFCRNSLSMLVASVSVPVSVDLDHFHHVTIKKRKKKEKWNTMIPCDVLTKGIIVSDDSLSQLSARQ